MNSSVNSPSVSGGTGGESKGKRKQNVVPVEIKEILSAPEEGFTVEGQEVGMVTIVGKVTDCEKATTKTTYRIQDESGEVEVIQWVEEGQTLDEFAEGTNVKVFGSIRTNQGRRHMMAFKVAVISSQAEYDAHLLEVVYSKLKLRQLNQRINGQIGMSDGMSQSMMGGGLTVQGGGGAGGARAGGQSFGNKNYDLVYSVIKQTSDEAGCDRDTVFNQAKKVMSKTDMDNALDFLSSEGHIYSTIDEDHFKTTDGE